MANAYDMYFILPDNNTQVHIPVNPAKLDITYEGDNKHYNIINIGDIVRPRIPKLMMVEWESLFTAHAFQAILNDPKAFQPPDYYINLLRGLQMSEDVFRLVIARQNVMGHSASSTMAGLITTNIQAVIESFKTTENGGEVGDFYYTIKICEFRQYMPYAVTYSSVNGSTQARKTQQRAVPPNQIYLGAKVTATGLLYVGPNSSIIATATPVQSKAGIVAYICPGALNPYQFIDSTGAVQGWARQESLSGVKNVGSG